MNEELKVVARRTGLWESVIRVYFFKRSAGVISVLSQDAWANYPEAQVYSEDTGGVDLPLTTAQQLMDELWDCGLRPTQGTGSAGAMAATEKHLADMQDLVDRLFKMLEECEKPLYMPMVELRTEGAK